MQAVVRWKAALQLISMKNIKLNKNELGTLAPVLSEIAPSHALQRANFVRQAPHRRCRSERAGGRQAGLDYPADDESRGRDRSHESGKSDVMGAVNELHPLPGRGNHQDGTNLLLREVKL